MDITSWMDNTLEDNETIDLLSDRTDVVKADPFDPESIKDLFAAFQGKIADLHTTANIHEVSDDSSHEQAVEMVGQAKKLSSRIEKERRTAKEPYLEMGKAIDNFCNPFKSSLNQIVGILQEKIRPYMVKLDQERQDAQRKAEEEARKMQAEIAAKARAEAQERALKGEPDPVHVPVPEIVPQVVPAVTKTQTESGSVSLKSEWKGTITDIRQLPDECFQARWSVIEKAIMPWVNAQIKAGVRSIPGVEIKEISRVAVRSRK